MYTLNRESTKRAVELLKHTVGGEDNSQITLLSYMVLRFTQNRVTFEATNLTTGAILDAFADTTNAAPIDFCIPFKVFADLVGKLKGEHITLTPVFSDAHILTGVGVACGKYVGTLPALDADDFPLLPKTYGSNPTILPSEWLASLHRRVGFAAATDHTTPIIQGVFISGEGTTILAAATDRYRVVETSRTLDHAIEPLNLVIPARALKLFAEAAKQEWFMPTVELGINAQRSMVILKSGDMIMTCRVIEGAYPKYQRGFPNHPNHQNKEPGWSFALGVDTLKSAVDLVSLTTDVDNRIVLTLKDNGLLGNVCVIGAGVANHRGRGETTLDIVLDSTTPINANAIVGVHAAFLASILSAIPNDRAEVFLYNKNTALMVVAPEWRAIIQPMSLI